MLRQMFSEFLSNPSSLLLAVILGPITLILVLISHLKRVWAIGTNYFNVSNFVSDHNDLIMNPLLALSASQLGLKIRDPSDAVTAEILLEMFISQSLRVNPLLQAIVGTRYDQARVEAQEIDRLVREGKVPLDCRAFWGVPIVVKECFEMKDMPFSGGLWGRRDVVGLSTGPVISQVQRDGAIIFASTNTSEACMYHESVNHVYGTTHNPYDLRRTAGGSSGGCASAVAACCAPFAVTSDVGGSTRIPALYNCLFGHKPTGGAICNKNTFPPVGDKGVKRFCQLGPTCRHSEDLWPLLESMLSREADAPLVDECVVLPLLLPPLNSTDPPSGLQSTYDPRLSEEPHLLLALLHGPPRDRHRDPRRGEAF
jgi:fatty acid amide hydrolase 2